MSVKRWFGVSEQSAGADVALLVVRLVCGYAFMAHGWGKIQNPFGWAGDSSIFPTFLLGLAALAEFGGGLAWILGLLTRLASFGVVCTMIVAAGMHKFVMGDPFINLTGGRSYEMAVLFLMIALLLLTVGPGRFSLDRKVFGLRR